MNDSRLSSSDRWFVSIFLLLTGLNVLTIWATPFDLSPDEAHYAEWSKRIDWAYYSKGPAVAVLIRAGTMLFGDSTFAARLPAACCFAFFSFLLYVFLRQLVGPRPALAAWLASRSMPIIAQTGVLMTTDAPAALFWLVAVICAHRAVVEEEPPYWVGFGAAVGLGVLAKYTVGILYPSIFLFLFLTPHLRRHLIHPAFIAGSIVLVFTIFPVLKWNADHDWVNFAHNATHLSGKHGFRPNPLYAGELLLGQLGLVGPILFVGMLSAFWVAIREWKQDDRVSGLLLFSAAPLGFLVVFLSLFKRVYANWPLPVYISGLLLLAHLIANYRIVSQRVTRLIPSGILLSGFLTFLAHLVFFGLTLGVPLEVLPTRKLVGWHELARKVDEHIIRIKQETGRMPFVLTTDYQVASEIGFYSATHPEVMCANLGGRRMNQYDIWGGWRQLRGKNALIVIKDHGEEPALHGGFRTFQPLQGDLPVEFGTLNVRTFRFFFGTVFNGVPHPLPEAR